MDEAHVLAGADEPSVARDALVKYAKEGRNYGLSLGLATQQPSALDARLMSQVETLIVHQLTAPRDAAVATQNMRSPEPTKIRVDGSDVDVATLLRRLGQGVAAFSCGNAPSLSRLCVLRIRPRVTAHGGYEA
jgi:DNA segregation ATPase FtsK/SpoIIIE-like protein